MQEAKKLLIGETVLAKTFRTDKDNIIHSVEVRYGNVLYPPINGQIYHIDTEEEYLEILRNFLDDNQPEDVDYQIMHDGRDYEIPSQDEIDKATIEMLNREQRAKNKIKQKEEETKSHELNVQDVKQALQDSQRASDALDETIETNLTPVALDTKELEDKLASRFNSLETIIEQNDAQNQILAKQLRNNKILSTILTLLLLLSLAGIGYLYYNRNKPVDETYTLININGLDYQVPLAQVEVEEGQKKILIYGFTTTKQNGEIIHEAIPLGEYYMDKDSVPENKPEENQEEPQEEVSQEESQQEGESNE